MRKEDESAWVFFLRENGLPLAGGLFLFLTAFTLTLEFRTWTKKVDLETRETALAALKSRAAAGEERERAYEHLVILQSQLDEWRQARQSWGDTLRVLDNLRPSALTLQRMSIRQPLGGTYVQPDPYLPARVVPERIWDYRVTGDGEGGQTAELIGRYVMELKSAGATIEPLRVLTLDGLESFEADGRIQREFQLSGTGRRARAETRP